MAGPFIWNGTNSKALTATASAANFVYGFNTTATSAGTLTLTGISAGIQQLTGTSTHDVVLPATNLVALGFQFQIINRSTQTVTVKDSTGGTVQAMATQTVLTVTASVSGAPGTWDVNYNDTAFAIPLAVAKGGTGTTTGSITGTGALTFTAGGANQNVTLTPSGTGFTVLNGKVGLNTTSPLQNLSFIGDAVQTFGMNRGSVANTAGYSLTIQAGSATSGSTDKAGGNLILSSGISTGTQSSIVIIRTYSQGTAGTTDNAAVDAMALSGAQAVIPGRYVTGGATTAGGLQLLYGASGSVANFSIIAGAGGTSNLIISDVKAAAERLRIDASGNFGFLTNAPGSVVTVNGSFQPKLSALSANTTLDGTYHAMTVDASAAATTITLPAASATIIGRVYRIKKIDSSVNAVIIARTGANTIDGAPNYLLTTQYQSVDVICSSATTWSIF